MVKIDNDRYIDRLSEMELWKLGSAANQTAIEFHLKADISTPQHDNLHQISLQPLAKPIGRGFMSTIKYFLCAPRTCKANGRGYMSITCKANGRGYMSINWKANGRGYMSINWKANGRGYMSINWKANGRGFISNISWKANVRGYMTTKYWAISSTLKASGFFKHYLWSQKKGIYAILSRYTIDVLAKPKIGDSWAL